MFCIKTRPINLLVGYHVCYNGILFECQLTDAAAPPFAPDSPRAPEKIEKSHPYPWVKRISECI